MIDILLFILFVVLLFVALITGNIWIFIAGVISLFLGYFLSAKIGGK